LEADAFQEAESLRQFCGANAVATFNCSDFGIS
jgi:hypothetical protein